MITKALSLGGALCLTASLLFSQAETLSPDRYVGGDPTSTNPAYQGDVIGESSIFEIHGARTILNDQGNADPLDDTMTIQIFSEYFDDILNNSSGLLNTRMGDLFISTNGLSTDLSGDPETSNDTLVFDGWTHVIDLTNLVGSGAENTVSSIYEIDPDTASLAASNDLYTSDDLTNGIYRGEQVVEYVSGGTEAGFASVSIKSVGSLLAATVAGLDDPQDLPPSTGFDTNIEGETIDSSDKYLEIVLNTVPDSLKPQLSLDGSSIISGETLGFQWAMTCANDITQWLVQNDLTPVPEPATIALVTMLGLGFIVYRRRRTQVQASA